MECKCSAPMKKLHKSKVWGCTKRLGPGLGPCPWLFHYSCGYYRSW